MKNLSINPTGISSVNPRLCTLIANAWLANLRYHASSRDQLGVFELSSVTQVEKEASRKIAYEITSTVHSSLNAILRFSDCYKKHDGLGRPSPEHIMKDDKTVFLHGVLLLGLDTEIAPQFAVKLKQTDDKLVSPMELLLGLNLNAYNRLYEYANTGCYSNTLSDEAQRLILEFADKQIRNIRKYLKSTNEALCVDVSTIEQIGKEYKYDLGYQVSVLKQAS